MPASFEKAGTSFKVGDQVLVQQGGAEELPYVARIDRISRAKSTQDAGYDLGVTWFYR